MMRRSSVVLIFLHNNGIFRFNTPIPGRDPRERERERERERRTRGKQEHKSKDDDDHGEGESEIAPKLQLLCFAYKTKDRLGLLRSAI